jgi:parallel beta helix pectate lyase-like protein
MTRFGVGLLVLAAGLAAAATVLAHRSEAAPAAAIQRTFVSTSGNDANPCTRTDPCRNFQVALANTLAGGEVVALDSGGYGPVTVDKSASIVGAPGVHAAITAFTGNGVTVSAGETDVVVLRNLYVTGLGGDNGVRVFSGGSVHVESVTVSGFTNRGIRVTAELSPVRLIVRDSVFRHNNGGVIANGTNGDLRVQIEHTRADRNDSNGFWFLGPVKGSVTGSTAALNSGSGFFFQPEAEITVSDSVADGNVNGFAIQTPGTGTIVTLDRVAAIDNAGDGVFASFESVVRISGSEITRNGTGLHAIAATLESYGDNLVRGNGTNISGTITAVGKT